ncbi:sugar transferase [Nocardioides pantholopis]|uniref:sugar transferase n=1 Tax=Nocardioides pantholopis TaxID=2483798 RepID=UPI000FD897F2|nr:sugar transferase [Nocardioides pantholopis]
MTILSDAGTRLIGRRPSRALRLVPFIAALIDLACIAVATVVATLGRERFDFFERPADVSDTISVVGPLIALVWLMTIFLLDGHQRAVFDVGTDEFRRVIDASLLTAGVVGVVCYLLKFDLSRGFFVLEFALGLPLLLLGRAALRRSLHSARRRGALRHRVLVAGTPEHVDDIVGVLRREPWLGYEVVGCLTPARDLAEETPLGVPVLGNTDDAATMAVTSGVDVVFFAGGSTSSANQMRRAIWELERHDVQILVAPSVTDISGDRVRIRPVGGLPLIHVEPPTWTDASRWGKRLFDLVGSACLILAFSPLLLLAAARVKLYDRGPVLFRQTRIGRDGREFGCFKFRTMVVDAEKLVADMQAELGQSALLFKVKDDPRITKPGAWLRRFSVDELPQLFNVFKGDMSLVGPRPQVAREVALYDSAMSRRLHVRPGMTGLWQVSGRNDLTAQEAIRLDLYYVDNWSMVQDLTILAKTIGAVFSSRGAY